MKKVFKLFSKVAFVFLAFCLAIPTFAQSPKNEIENLQVDVVYKYIDLSDPTLHRDGIPQAKKDSDNNELMYSIRSVLKNIPWIRKIFIIMPNDKVKFLKETKDIKDKIVYIKDKDILGFDSSSCEAFIWALWKLKKFGCSEHIIFFNDDCFIGQPMKKSDFFYKDKNGKVTPYIFYNSPIKYTSKEEMGETVKKLDKQTTERHEKIQSGLLYNCQNAHTFDFLFSALNKDFLYVPAHCGSTLHNASAFNLSHIKKMYDIVNSKYKYADISLRRKLGRSKYGVLMREFHDFYYLNKENRKINKNIKYRYFSLSNRHINSDRHLFCINAGGHREYEDVEKVIAKLQMERLFPKPTEYEREDYDDWKGIDPNLKKQAAKELRM